MKFIRNNTLRRTLPIVPLVASCFALAAPASHAQSSPYLTIGDSAPALKPAKWLKGAPVPRFEPGKLYVVEFWATWCGPCKENIPHLTQLATKYQNQVSIIGVSIWENAKGGQGDYFKRVAAFVDGQGAAMDYTVAVDGTKNDIADAYMKPAGEKGIPCSFIVDRAGKIAWIGYPAQMDAVLEKMVAGTYDPAPAREKRETQMQLLRPIDEAMEEKNYRLAAGKVEKAIAKKPDLFYSLTHTYLVALYHADLKKGMTVSRNILSSSDHAPGAYQLMGSIFATQPDLSPTAYKFGVQLLDEALGRWPQDFMYRAMQAEVVFHLGRKPEALRLAKQALTAAEHAAKVSPEATALIRKNIARYERSK